ncbi:hypothetical protein [Streptomyces griseocarneus]|uniref:hypothetical protein n=1 Tax=Streptomyces griseocarneus TaxID=51201 RepID=UPI00167E25A3|nr:hypothetical protein [Streptomyces griseocarneus]MBZ6473994.1 hypothetical protein [Streptomyces griseocarneus]GHG66253.1 hypothetical protein GCM10018779_37680 [Streptomyces griseocarneus]
MNAFIAAMQLLVAAAFLSIPLVRHRYGATATAAARAELERQGVRTTVLAENGMRFDAGGHETWAPVAIATVVAAAAGLNLAGGSWAGAVTWSVLGLVLAINCVILYSNLTAVKSVEAAFARKGDPELARIDVAALLKTAESGFPAWVWVLQNARHVVVFGASALALASLALA